MMIELADKIAKLDTHSQIAIKSRWSLTICGFCFILLKSSKD